jgi:competence ComEA-like helix-hairpin-helix protein
MRATKEDPDDADWESHALRALGHRNRAWGGLACTSLTLAIGWIGWQAIVEPSQEELPDPLVVDLNRATEAELNLLPGMGPKSVHAILTYREQSGGFRRVEDLTNIPGIKEGKLKTLLPYITVDSNHARR